MDGSESGRWLRPRTSTRAPGVQIATSLRGPPCLMHRGGAALSMLLSDTTVVGACEAGARRIWVNEKRLGGFAS